MVRILWSLLVAVLFAACGETGTEKPLTDSEKIIKKYADREARFNTWSFREGLPDAMTDKISYSVSGTAKGMLSEEKHIQISCSPDKESLEFIVPDMHPYRRNYSTLIRYDSEEPEKIGIRIRYKMASFYSSEEDKYRFFNKMKSADLVRISFLGEFDTEVDSLELNTQNLGSAFEQLPSMCLQRMGMQ